MQYLHINFFENIKKKRYILLFTWIFFCLTGYLENKGYSIANIFREDYLSNRFNIYLKIIFNYIFLCFGYLLLVVYYKGFFSNFVCKNSIKIYKRKCILIILVYLPLSFIFEWLNYTVNNTFSKTIALIIITLLNISKYMIMFQFARIITFNSSKNEFKKTSGYFFTKSTFILIITSIITTSLFVIIISAFLDNYFSLNVGSDINYLAIIEYYRYNGWVSFICIFYQAFISSFLVYKSSGLYYHENKKVR